MGRNSLPVLVVTLSILFASCTAIPIPKDAITFDTPPGVQLPFPARASINMESGDLNKTYTVNQFVRTWVLEEGKIIQSAALKVFSLFFRDVAAHEGNVNAHVIIKPSGLTHVDTFWGTYHASVTAVFYSGKGDYILTVQGRGKFTSALVNDAIALENAYVNAFQDVCNELLKNKSLQEKILNRAATPPAIDQKPDLEVITR